jgi:hypothetical protein
MPCPRPRLAARRWPAGRLALSTLALSLLVADAASAQDRSWPPQYRRDRAQFALEAAGQLSQLNGNAVASATEGSGFDVMASLGVSVLSLGAGYQRSSHRLGTGDATVDGFFFEPRLALPLAARNFTPFVYGRVARLERSVPGEIGTLETRGTGLGAGLGTYIWLAPNIQLNTTVGWSEVRFGDPGVTAGFPVAGRTTGNSWTVRAGVTLGFDRWGR